MSTGVVIRRFIGSSLQTVGPREFGGNAGSPDLQDDGYALDLRGGDLSRLQSGNAPFLWMHNTDEMLGRVLSIRATDTELPFRARFLDAGVSPVADRRCRELKGGAGFGVSLSFLVDEEKPIKGGKRATKWRALELSLCSVPIDAKAVITERGRRAANPMKSALSACDVAMEEHRAADEHYGAMAGALDRIDEHRRRTRAALRDFKRALEAGNAEEAAEAHTRCRRCLDSMSRELSALGDRHDDATGAHSALARALREAGGALGIQADEADAHGERSSDRDRRRRAAEALAMPTVNEDFDRRQRQLEALELAANV